MTRQNALIYRKKRVFIDLEYINEKDLQKTFKELFSLISQGKEKSEQLTYYKTTELYNCHKQWYLNTNRDIEEINISQNTIHIVKSKV